MAVQFTMTLSGRSGDKTAVVKTAVLALPAADEITIMMGDDIDLKRRVEIFDGLRWLYRGLVERDLFTEFAGANTVSSVPLDDRSEAARKTASDLTVVAVDDIAIAISATLMDDSKGHGTIETAFHQLRSSAREDASW